MKASLLKESLEIAIRAKRPAMIWSSPGMGKSQIVKQVADKLYAKKFNIEFDKFGKPRNAKTGKYCERPYFIDVRASLLDPVDLRGIPRIDEDNVTRWCRPVFFPIDGEGIVFLDELTAAVPIVQASLYQWVLDGKLGEATMGEGWTIVAASNRDTDRAVTYRMPTPLRNRFIHIDLDFDIAEWVEWAFTKKPEPVSHEIIDFARARPKLLSNFDPTKNENAFGTPRSVGDFLDDIFKQKPSEELTYELYKGIVGEGVASEFLAHLKVYGKLPKPELCLTQPEDAPVPTDPSSLYALCGSLASVVNEKLVEGFFKYISRIPVEFSVLAVRDTAKLHKSLIKTRPFVEWASKNANVLI